MAKGTSYTTEERVEEAPQGPARCWILRLLYSGDEVLVPPLRFALKAAVTAIGREADGVPLPQDRRASRCHATLHRGPGGVLFLRDEGSRNGSFRNGARVSEEQLADGDVLSIGDSLFIVRWEALAPQEERFRGDLYARLAESPMRCERREDILPLFVQGLGAGAPRLAPRLAEALLLHPAVFQVRELFALAATLGIRACGRERLDLDLWPERPHGEPAPPAPPALQEITLQQEGDVWRLRAGGAELRLKDGKGLRYLHHLLLHPDREFHVSQLIALTEGVEEAELPAGDAGAVLDPRAREAYRRRLVDLREVEEEAARFGDRTRAARAAAEIEALTQQLAQAVGLGGRERRLASSAERARINVQRRLRDALARIEEQHPALGRYLGAAIRTGTFCSYAPVGVLPGAPQRS